MSDTSDMSLGGPAAYHASFKAVMWDYARGLFSLAVIGGILSMAVPGSIIWLILVALFAAFLLYVANAFWRHGLRLELDEAGVTAGWHNPLDTNGMILLGKKRLEFDGLTGLRLRHFSRKRETKSFELLMVVIEGVNEKGKASKISFDGAHEGLEPVLAATFDALPPNVFLDEATLANLEEVGIDTTGSGR